jgi:hypothetical protein
MGRRPARGRLTGNLGAATPAPAGTRGAGAARRERATVLNAPDTGLAFAPPPRQDDVLRRAVALFNAKNWKKIGARAAERAAGARAGAWRARLVVRLVMQALGAHGPGLGAPPRRRPPLPARA